LHGCTANPAQRYCLEAVYRGFSINFVIRRRGVTNIRPVGASGRPTLWPISTKFLDICGLEN
jgi:hypothetical protein